jgi:GTPase
VEKQLLRLAFFERGQAMLIDQVTIEVKAGDGGNGSNAMRALRSKHKKLPYGGPGGKGGAVYLKTDGNCTTLLDLSLKNHYEAERGQHGGTNNRRGRSGKDLAVTVPRGTQVWDADTRLLLRDLTLENQTLVVVQGGEGGTGNSRQKKALSGLKGEFKNLSLELKLIAQVGLIGFPNSGKSTLINRLTGSKAKVADYPFSTLEPQLGVLEDKETFQRAVICDIPGLIEGAHEGRGLGLDFLRHVERTQILLHLVEMQDVKGLSPVERYQKITTELESHQGGLMKKVQVVAATKIDLPDAEEHLKCFQQSVGEGILPVSATTGAGIEALKKVILEAVRKCEGERGW